MPAGYQPVETEDADSDANLPQFNSNSLPHNETATCKHYAKRSARFYIFASLLLISPLLVFLLRTSKNIPTPNPRFTATTAAPWIGQYTHDTPATDNWGTSEFPTKVGYAGATATGIEAFAMETSPSLPFGLVAPCKDQRFIREHHYGHMSPYFSAPQAEEIPDASVHIPSGYQLEEVHLLHRHGSRYPTTLNESIPYMFAKKLSSHRNNLKFSGPLKFLNEWNYPLGIATLTTRGRGEMFDSGIRFRMWYGKLLNSLTHKLVIRVGSEQRMLDSALHFIGGFFGLPLDGNPYHLVVPLEELGQNNTFTPWKNCERDHDPKDLPRYKLWKQRYLQKAVDRFQPFVAGVSIKHDDVYRMMELCTFETASLGGSEFCGLFTDDEWRNFDYGSDLLFDEAYGFGCTMAESYGIGYIQELVARLTKTPIETHNSTTNSTLHSPHTFPLDQQLYFDFSHDTHMSAVIVALGLKQFAKALPTDKIATGTYWKISHITPFAGNLVFQVLTKEKQRFIRIVLNDAVLSLEHIGICGKDRDGLCDLNIFVDTMKKSIQRVNYTENCKKEKERQRHMEAEVKS